LKIGNSRVRTLHVPCHTKGHTIYSFLPLLNEEKDDSPNLVDHSTLEGKKIRVFESESCTFTGDTLFVGGIGRFFEGNAG
jgi:hydroxyacylglutathione hydrolase